MTYEQEDCEECARLLKQPPVGRPRVYCSSPCRQKAYRQRVRKTQNAALDVGRRSA